MPEVVYIMVDQKEEHDRIQGLCNSLRLTRSDLPPPATPTSGSFHGLPKQCHPLGANPSTPEPEGDSRFKPSGLDTESVFICIISVWAYFFVLLI